MVVLLLVEVLWGVASCDPLLLLHPVMVIQDASGIGNGFSEQLISDRLMWEAAAIGVLDKALVVVVAVVVRGRLMPRVAAGSAVDPFPTICDKEHPLFDELDKTFSKDC